MSYNDRIEVLLDELSVFSDWQERYEYIISLGHGLAPLPSKYRKPENLIKGCQSQVWVGTEVKDGQFIIYADSDSLITKGLIAIFIRLLSGLSPTEVLAADLKNLMQAGSRNILGNREQRTGLTKSTAVEVLNCFT